MLNTFEGVRTAERTIAELLDGHGEAEMAELFRTDREGYERRREAGPLFFFGPDEDEEVEDDPGWLGRLLRAVAASRKPGLSVRP